MAEFDPNVSPYLDTTTSAESLDSADTLSKIATMPGVDLTKQVSPKRLTDEDIEKASVPMNGLSPEERAQIEEFQVRMGVGQMKSQGRTSTRSYHYFK